jgi:hypothetical protein
MGPSFPRGKRSQPNRTLSQPPRGHDHNPIRHRARHGYRNKYLPNLGNKVLLVRPCIGLHEICRSVLMLVAPTLGGPASPREAGPLLSTTCTSRQPFAGGPGVLLPDRSPFAVGEVRRAGWVGATASLSRFRFFILRRNRLRFRDPLARRVGKRVPLPLRQHLGSKHNPEGEQVLFPRESRAICTESANAL